MPEGTTSTDLGHNHDYGVDNKSNGNTGFNNDHMHIIKNWIVTVVNNHRHTIPKG